MWGRTRGRLARRPACAARRLRRVRVAGTAARSHLWPSRTGPFRPLAPRLRMTRRAPAHPVTRGRALSGTTPEFVGPGKTCTDHCGSPSRRQRPRTTGAPGFSWLRQRGPPAAESRVSRAGIPDAGPAARARVGVALTCTDDAAEEAGGAPIRTVAEPSAESVCRKGGPRWSRAATAGTEPAWGRTRRVDTSSVWRPPAGGCHDPGCPRTTRGLRAGADPSHMLSGACLLRPCRHAGRGVDRHASPPRAAASRRDRGAPTRPDPGARGRRRTAVKGRPPQPACRIAHDLGPPRGGPAVGLGREDTRHSPHDGMPVLPPRDRGSNARACGGLRRHPQPRSSGLPLPSFRVEPRRSSVTDTAVSSHHLVREGPAWHRCATPARAAQPRRGRASPRAAQSCPGATGFRERRAVPAGRSGPRRRSWAPLPTVWITGRMIDEDIGGSRRIVRSCPISG